MIKWQWHSFEELSNQQLYAVLQLREQVFTFEQKCTERDIDGDDLTAIHLLGYVNDDLAAYLYVKFKTGVYIGRVVVNPTYQGKGLGRSLMAESIRYIKDHHPNSDIELSAQSYLEKFYHSLGFVTEGEPYLEGGIEHFHMRLAR